MVKTGISFDEATLLLVLRFDIESEIHKAGSDIEAQALLDICILLPTRVPYFSSADLCKEDQAAS